mmetsp:Transcript_68259/g.142658  ORF Transcript_68259/g.142658 Transcript_68259/m.142658 type:complete len:811 (-) Transcript_68259:259-2691(-)|eukprot:CAMPEP_0206442798 /NCGR_PEP_ID=MMETSP0324_2-20121206/14018_1 /ASSEMBLY_ACC=CAM_ASM_000836 /TAXON_ID=2866 /ORGANISM="Crypthecodinium cohnii, Strain Seligo" /LENGTH=810 /DNA_ID=CAMNT_0053910673 /DNA_START=197 /DNA_END=2629 /DNA_ORIENTATION=+
MELPEDISLNKYSLEFSYSELQRATDNFDSSRRLGKGAFGAVYKGVRPSDGTEIAVKALDVPQEAGFEEEVRVLSKFRHPNLVILMGFARRNTQRLLVYELLEGGDVFHRLQRSTRGTEPFSWRARVSAAYDACCGLSHLHNSKPKAFHRDIKSANILLDRNGTAKMADFGLACLSNYQAHQVQHAGGTPGYACPHYARNRVVTEGSEVYSFGVVLLEMLTATAPAWLVRGANGGKEYNFLVSIINGSPSCAVSMADGKAQWPTHVAETLADLGLVCSNYQEEHRPKFAEVVAALRTLRNAPDAATPPPTPTPPPARVPLHYPAPVRPGVNMADALAAALAPSFGMGQQAEANPEVRPLGSAALQHGQGPGVAKAAAAAFNRPQQQQMAGHISLNDHSNQQNKAASSECLWSLECVYTDPMQNVASVPLARRSIEHHRDLGSKQVSVLKVGRRHQEDIFAALIPQHDIRNMVSRDHFQVWALDAADAVHSQDGRRPCSFFVTNLSSNYTSVNGCLLDAPDKHAQIHEGDLIGLGTITTTTDGMQYSPFIQFRFHLTGSVLCDATAVKGVGASGAGESTSAGSPLVGGSSDSSHGADDHEDVLEQAEPTDDLALSESEADAEASAEGTLRVTLRSAQPSSTPRFALEIGGSGLKDGVWDRQKHIVHGPNVSSDGTEDASKAVFEPLVLGRGHSTTFWLELLREDTFQCLSREHVVFEPHYTKDSSSAAHCGVSVRNMSRLRPVRVTNSTDEELFRDFLPLVGEERRVLRHGDIVVLNAAKAASLWVVFHDLQQATSAEGKNLQMKIQDTTE